MSAIKSKIKDLPKAPGIYQFIGGNGEILYIGKAKNLSNRVKSYFLKEIGRGPAIDLMVAQAIDLKFIQTDSEIEAVILEADLIGKLKPKYNIRLKDDKSFLMIQITKEDYPKVSLVRYKDVNIHDKTAQYFGPYPAGDLLKRSLRYLRRIFPYLDCTTTKYSRYQKAGRPCLYGDIGVCTAPCVDRISKEEYNKNITYLKNFLRGRKGEVVKKLEREMRELSRQKNFEVAAIIRDRLYALQHIGDVAIGLKDDFTTAAKLAFKRIECYDIANISGQHSVGSMVVFTNGEADKAEYRKFKIKNQKSSVSPFDYTQGMSEVEYQRIKMMDPNLQTLSNTVISSHPEPTVGWTEGGEKSSQLQVEISHNNKIGDIQMIQEVLERRFNNDWPLPDLIVIDGGVAHLNVALKTVRQRGLDIPVVSIAKGPKRDKNEFHYSDHAIAEYIHKNPEMTKIAVRARDEAHRFAGAYYRKVHSREMLKSDK